MGYSLEFKATRIDDHRDHPAEQSRNGTRRIHKRNRWRQPDDPTRTASHSCDPGTQRTSTRSRDCTGHANSYTRQCRHSTRREQTSWNPARWNDPESSDPKIRQKPGTRTESSGYQGRSSDLPINRQHLPHFAQSPNASPHGTREPGADSER